MTTDTVERGPESTIHTALENLHLESRVRLSLSLLLDGKLMLLKKIEIIYQLGEEY